MGYSSFPSNLIVICKWLIFSCTIKLKKNVPLFPILEFWVIVWSSKKSDKREHFFHIIFKAMKAKWCLQRAFTIWCSYFMERKHYYYRMTEVFEKIHNDKNFQWVFGFLFYIHITLANISGCWLYSGWQGLQKATRIQRYLSFRLIIQNSLDIFKC